MKTFGILLVLLILFPGIGQEIDKELKGVQDTCELYVCKGLILAIEPGRINFEEMWLRIPNPETKIEHNLMLTITDEIGRKIEYRDLHAPFLAEIAYTIISDQAIVTKIKILKQYRYDENGFVKE